MSIAADLLALQDTDLALERERTQLAELPILAELAKKRKSHARLKSEATRLFAERKDIETELAELDARERACNEGVTAAQARPLDSSDYRAVQELQNELADFAKRLDKLAFTRPEVVTRLEDAREREAKLKAYIERFEQSIVADTRKARSQAASIKQRIEIHESERERIAHRLPADSLAVYEAAAKRFKGLAVERLEGRVPSICRTTLQASSMDELRRAGEVGECPYCHRLIVLSEEQ